MSNDQPNTVTVTFNGQEGDTAAVRVNNDSAVPLQAGGSVTVPLEKGAIVVFQQDEKTDHGTNAEELEAGHAAAAASHAKQLQDIADAEAAEAAAKVKAEEDQRAADQAAADAAAAAFAAANQTPAVEAPAEGENAPAAEDEPVEGKVYDIAGIKSVYGKFADEDGNEAFGYLPLAQTPAEVVAQLLADGEITQADFDAVDGGLKPVAPAAAPAATGSKKK